MMLTKNPLELYIAALMAKTEEVIEECFLSKEIESSLKRTDSTE